MFIRSNIGDEIEGIDVDSEGNVAISGTCAGNATIGLATNSLFLPASEQGRKTVSFVASLTNEGRLRWIKGLQSEDNGRDSGDYAVSLSINKNNGEILTTRAHCNEHLRWAVYIEGFDKNGKNIFYKTLGLSNTKRNTGFWKSSCGVANVFIHRSNYQNNTYIYYLSIERVVRYIYREGRQIYGKDFVMDASSSLASTAHSGGTTRFFIAQYRAGGTATPQPPVITEPPLPNSTAAVWVYDQAAFQGRSQSLLPGTYDMRQLSIGNDAISSVKVPQGMHVILFEHANFEGARLTLRQDSRALGDFNKLASSVIVERINGTNTNSNTSDTNSNTSSVVSFKGCPTGKEVVSAENERFEKEVLRLVNIERQKQGLSPLLWNNDLSRAARYHAADMHTDKYFEHDSYDRRNGVLVKVCDTFEHIRQFGRGFAENIAINPSGAEEVMQSWMKSPGHCVNILGRHQSLGVGFYKGYWVQVFGQ